MQTDSLCPRHWDRNHQQSSRVQSENAVQQETAHRDQALLLTQGSSDDFSQVFLWLVCLWVFVWGFGGVFFKGHISITLSHFPSS